METVNNPMTRLALLYQRIEAYLRKGPESTASMYAHHDIRELSKGQHQVKAIITGLKERGHIIQRGERAQTTYEWDKASPPFIFTPSQRTRMKTEPSAPTVTTQVGDRAKVATRAKEIELVFEHTLIIVGRNPKTGRLRFIIEEE